MAIINNVESEAKGMIAIFKKDFFEKFGVYPDVYYNLIPDEPRKSVSLKAFEELVNQVYESVFPNSCYEGGIRSRKRKREIVIFRQLFFSLAQEMGFGPSYLGCFLNFDHATVIHSRKAIRNLLDSNDRDTVLYHNLVKDAFKKRFSPDGNVFQNIGSRADTE
jgi:hypothetical protein